MTLSEVVDAYDRAWRADPTERRRLLERSLTDDAELIFPDGHCEGREAIAEWIDGFGERVPGGSVHVTSGIDSHNDFARYVWTVSDKDGASVMEGIDVCELSDDGRLHRVVMFFGPIPPRA